jgi:hypothetical protein
MVPSAVINEAIVFITALSLRAVIRRTPREKLPESFRYFTILSNLFCAFTALILLLCEFFGALPAWAATLKYMGTVAVALTFFVVLLFLWPSLGSIQGLWDGPELFLHFVTPLLAVLSFLFYEKQGLSAWIIPLGLVPVLLYGWLYLNRVVIAKTWRDMYGFNKNGRWKLSFSLLVLGTVAIAVLLWWL